MRRRTFVPVVGGALALWPFAAHAQQLGKTHRVAIFAGADSISDMSEAIGLRHWRAWYQELRRLGYAEGRNLVVEKKSTNGDRRRVPQLVQEIVGLKPDVIFAPPPDLVRALAGATTTIPIIAFSADPVRSGFAATLARPGRNITGFTIDAGPELIAKRMALLKEAIPTLTRLGALMLREFWESWIGDAYRDSGQRLGLTIIAAPLDAPVNEQSYRRVFAALTRERADAVLVSAQSENIAYRVLIAELASEARLPTMYHWREQVEVGGLMGYTIDLSEGWRGVAGYIDLILKGANPANLPFQQPNKYELIINLKTARALGLVIPPALMVRADEVIE